MLNRNEAVREIRAVVTGRLSAQPNEPYKKSGDYLLSACCEQDKCGGLLMQGLAAGAGASHFKRTNHAGSRARDVDTGCIL